MYKYKHIAQAEIWVTLLANMEKRPRLVGILQSIPLTALQFASKCREYGISVFCSSPNANSPLIAETIAASGCDTLICDRRHYSQLVYILSLQPKPMTVILNEECWTPDWCWQLSRHHFLCQQDVE